jgi:hypothetical protein
MIEEAMRWITTKPRQNELRMSLAESVRCSRMWGKAHIQWGLALVLVLLVLTDARAQTVFNRHDLQVATAAELLAAATDPTVTEIVLSVNLTDLPTFRLSPGQTLRGASPTVVLRFAAGRDGVQLSTNNRVESLKLDAS